jgi:hypothetical protein
MKITIEFDTDNAAWEDNWISETDRIMANVVNNVHDAFMCPGAKMDTFSVTDSNGNKIGTVKIKI